MITVITGLPGSGKTAKCVEGFLMPLAAKDYTEKAIDPDGNEVQVRRRIFTNVNGLLLDHEKMDEDMLKNWHEWVKPGDLIVYDEVQKPWPYTVANKTQDKCITELETHRHYGIDMILLTQHPMLVNSAVHRLAGQHLHVRKLGNSRFATVYEWDGVSRTLSYKAAFSKKAWRRGKEVEKTYKSSSLHTKQKRALPSVLFGVLFAVALLSWLGPSAYGRLSERVAGNSPKVGPPPGSVAKAPAAPASHPALPGPEPAPAPVAVAAAVPASAPEKEPAIGCARMRERCSCFDATGKREDKPAEFCQDMTLANAPSKITQAPESLDRFQSIGPTTRDAYGEALIAWADAENDRRRTTRNYGR